MKLNSKYNQAINLTFLVLGLSACKKFVTIDPPITQLVVQTVFADNASATSALTAIYSQMNYESYYMSLNTGLLSDELKNYAGGAQNLLYTNAMLSSASPSTWISAYKFIYAANAILEGLKKNTGVSPVIQQQLNGESKFIRAFWHFYLINCYGDVPIVISTDYAVNDVITRKAKAQVYQQIIADLNDALNLLNSNYVDASDTTITIDRVRPTKWAAAALLARAYLYTGAYDRAEIQATSIIKNSGMYRLCSDLDSVFLANSTESIWQLGIPLPSTLNTPDGYYYTLIGAPRSVSISSQLLSSFEPKDNRKANWIDSFTVDSISYYFPYKYKVRNSSAVIENVMVLRLAEQYLIRAEAKSYQNDLVGAADDLNVIRNRAGLPNTTATTQSDLLMAILHERQVELFTEWGHRWFDLIRMGNIDIVMGGNTGVCQAKGGSWISNGHQTLYPIPQSELGKNPNLIQNAGY